MPRIPDDDPITENEYPDEADLIDDDDDDSADMTPCDRCGKSVAHGVARCPYCGEWDPSQGSHSPSGDGRRRGIWTIAVFLLLAVIFTMWIGVR